MVFYYQASLFHKIQLRLAESLWRVIALLASTVADNFILYSLKSFFCSMLCALGFALLVKLSLIVTLKWHRCRSKVNLKYLTNYC